MHLEIELSSEIEAWLDEVDRKYFDLPGGPVPLECWDADDVVQMESIANAELQRRADEGIPHTC